MITTSAWSMTRRRLLALGLSLLLPAILSNHLYAQVEVSQGDTWERLLSKQLHLGLMTEEEVQQAQALYAELQAHPLDINTARDDELRCIPLLSDYQIYQLLHYRAEHGGLHEVSELKLVRGWGVEWLAILGPLLRCEPRDKALSWAEASLRASEGWQFFYGQKTKPSTSSQELLGPMNACRLQGHYQLPQHLRLFIAGEKDYGEPWHYAQHRGFDSYNAMAELQGKHLQLLLGDYRISQGSGLLLGQGLFPLSLRSLSPRFPQGIRPVQHSTEYRFSRGLAGRLYGERWELGAFFSRRAIDARRGEDGRLYGLETSGLHQTASSWRKRGGAYSRHYGGWLTYLPTPQLRLSLQLLHEDWAGALLHSPPGSHQQPALQDLSGYEAWSFAYQWQGRQGRLRLLGELAQRGKQAWAVVQHLSLLQQGWGALHLALWSLAPDYWSGLGQAGIRGAQPNDEQGARLIYQFTPAQLLGTSQCILEGYRTHPASTPRGRSREGYSIALSSCLPLRQDSELGLAWRYYRSERTSPSHRLRLRYQPPSSFPLLTHIWLALHKSGSELGWTSYLAGGASLTSELKVKLLLGYFQAKQWDTRLYALPPLLTGEYGALLLYGQGELLCARLQYRPSKRWRLEARLAHVQQQSTRPSQTTLALQIGYTSW